MENHEINETSASNYSSFTKRRWNGDYNAIYCWIKFIVIEMEWDNFVLFISICRHNVRLNSWDVFFLIKLATRIIEYAFLAYVNKRTRIEIESENMYRQGEIILGINDLYRCVKSLRKRSFAAFFVI